MIRKLLRQFNPDKRRFAASLKTLLGFSPNNLAIYQLAFRHKSAIGKGLNKAASNERLEFLGDAILGGVVAHMLFRKYPLQDEGFLTELRSKIVSRDNLNKLGLKLGLEKFIETGGDNNQRNRSMNGDAFEALIGAIYLDKGYKSAQKFIVNRILRHHVDVDGLEVLETNYKSRLIEWAQKERKTVSFEQVEEIGTGRQRQLRIQVVLNGEPHGQGVDFSKKRAEQIAAEATCKTLGI